MSTRADGYTILEALCAFAILASILVVLYGIGGTTGRLLVETQDSDRVALLVQSKLDELEAVRAPLPRFQLGTFPGTKFRWQLESGDALPDQEQATSYRLQKVKLTVLWPGLAGPDRFSVETRHLGIEQ